MKAAVIYYSLEGNTKQTAQRIAALTGADIIELKPVKQYPDKGFKKFFWGGKSAVMGDTPPLEPYSFDASAYDTIIFGSPVWASSFTPPVRTFIKDNAPALSGKRFAAFFCQSGSGAQKASEKLKKLLGTEELAALLVLIDPLSSPSPENDKAIEDFCAKI